MTVVICKIIDKRVIKVVYRNRFPGGRLKALTFSYDDGVQQDLRLLQIFHTYHMKATFNLNAGLMEKDKPWYLDDLLIQRLPFEKIKEYYQDFEVASHTLTHPRLDLLSSAGIWLELARDKVNLEHAMDCPIKGIAYPFGVYNYETIESLKELGIIYGRTTQSTGSFLPPEDFYQWHPTCHHNDRKLMRLADDFLNLNYADTYQIFYVWGHSYEFDSQHNWKRIENFCKKMQDHHDIWYATNVEICQYILDSRKLITSPGGGMVINPTETDIWISDENEQAICIPAKKQISVFTEDV